MVAFDHVKDNQFFCPIGNDQSETYEGRACKKRLVGPSMSRVDVKGGLIQTQAEIRSTSLTALEAAHTWLKVHFLLCLISK